MRILLSFIQTSERTFLAQLLRSICSTGQLSIVQHVVELCHSRSQPDETHPISEVLSRKYTLSNATSDKI